MKRRQFNALAAGLGSGLAGGAVAQGMPTAGQEYSNVATPVAMATPPGTIDVVEFFSFACPHCFEFEPTLESWLARKPTGIQFRRSPVPFMQNHDNFQRLYFALDAMGLADTLPQKVFNAVHLAHQRLDKPEDIAAFIASNGDDATRFMSFFNSFAIRAKAQQSTALFEALGIDSIGVPALAVQGRWVTSPRQAKGGTQALAVVDFLAAQGRAGH